MTSNRVCAFCPETANLTGEHLFADWIGRILHKKTGRYFLSHENASTKTNRRWRSRKLDFKYSSICATCNNTWMSRIDDAARNLLKDVILYGAELALLGSGISAVAKFAFKNALVIDVWTGTSFFSAQDRRDFKQTLQIPDGVHMWFGAVATNPGVPFGFLKSRYGQSELKTSDGVETYQFTWSAESLLIQVLAARWTNFLRRAREVPAVVQPREQDSISVPFWPQSGSPVTWPPKLWLPQGGVDQFADRHSGFMLSGLTLR